MSSTSANYFNCKTQAGVTVLAKTVAPKIISRANIISHASPVPELSFLLSRPAEPGRYFDIPVCKLPLLRPERCSKISKLTITELFYLHILNMIKSSRRIHLYVFRYRKWLCSPKRSRGFRETSPRAVARKKKLLLRQCHGLLFSSSQYLAALSSAEVQTFVI